MTRRPLRGPAALALTWALASTPAAAQLPAADLDAYVPRAMQQWEVPGLALAVVKDDSVVYLRGFGVRTLGRPEPVDPHTLFASASTTKAFTATALALLVDEGKVRWDDPVVKHLPEFQLADPYLTRELTVRDLLAHRSALPTADLLWYGSANDARAILRRLRHLRPTAGLRGRYAYNNNLYAVAGLVVEAASGMPWDAFVRRRILEPLEMRETATGYAGLLTRINVASPHLEVDDTLRVIPYRNLDNIAPAGAMNSSAAEMARWVRFQLDSARVSGRRLVSDSAWRETMTPQFVIPASSYYPAARLARPNFTAYGLGWFLQDYRGRKVALHTGSIDGMSALTALLPEERLGVVVLANLDHAELRHALMYRVFDLYLGGAPRDWSAELRALYGRLAEQGQARERAREARRVRGTRPTLPLRYYVGTYADSAYGELVVRLEEGKLVAEFGPGFSGELEHWHYDTFRARWADRALDPWHLTFTQGTDGRINGVAVESVGEFRRLPPRPPTATASP